ncbi:MAG: hypothetical protein ACLFT9_19540 [Coleofasciculus sp.]
MNHKIENSQTATSAQTQSTLQSELTKNDKSQQEQQRFWRRVRTGALAVAQATLIGVNGNLDVLSGQPVLDVIPGMITQGIELILKTQAVQKRLKIRDRNCNSCSD